jgi:hypothetical protein
MQMSHLQVNDQLVFTQVDIWEAVQKLKETSSDRLEYDIDFVDQIIKALAKQYRLDFKKLYVLVTNSPRDSNGLLVFSWDCVQGADIYTFHSDTYMYFAARVIDTVAARRWLMEHNLKNIIFLKIDHRMKPK